LRRGAASVAGGIAGFPLAGYGRDMREKDSGLASFGFRDVPAEEKPVLVREVFSSVARRYDLMNDLMSAGVHRLWKDRFVDWLNPQPGLRYLDVAGGTGDIARRIASRLKTRGSGKTRDSRASGEITVCDINPEMLAQGVARGGVAVGEVAWVCGDAERLPLRDASQDVYTIAFGIRNVTHIERALSEAHRVLAPGGRFLCLEFSRVTAPGLDALYDVYSFAVLPRLGEAVAGDGAAYRYLAESIRRFPPQNQFARMIARAGFSEVRVRNLSGGIAAMHSAWKI
jgi:demethylmenaquinone methyltransferase/2-methoxy-6-polyprenyl-1,4-benzoquinol methylase